MAVTRPGSPLVRETWVNRKLGEVAAKSFWIPYTGSSNTDIIYQAKDPGCANGHTVVFDFSGKLTGAGVRGDGEACILGEDKRKFSDKMVVEMFSFYVDNGTKFKACEIGDLNLPQHSDSISKLADLWVRQKDQAIFDTLLGATKDSCGPSHVYDLWCSFEWNDMAEIESALKTGEGFSCTNPNGSINHGSIAQRRAPMDLPFGDNNSYLFILTERMAKMLKNNPKYQLINMNADARGNNNALFTGVIHTQGTIRYVEAPVFYGETQGTGDFDIIEDTLLYQSGMRRYAVGANGAFAWEGQAQFKVLEALANDEKIAIAALPEDQQAAAEEARVNVVYSRGLILGASAAQTGFGASPDYAVAESKFGKKTESMLEVIFEVKKTNLTLERGSDYEAAGITNIDYSCVAVDMRE